MGLEFKPETLQCLTSGVWVPEPVYVRSTKTFLGVFRRPRSWLRKSMTFILPFTWKITPPQSFGKHDLLLLVFISENFVRGRFTQINLACLAVTAPSGQMQL